MRNKGLYDGIASAELLEKWAVRMADFGDTRSRETFEFNHSIFLKQALVL